MPNFFTQFQESSPVGEKRTEFKVLLLSKSQIKIDAINTVLSQWRDNLGNHIKLNLSTWTPPQKDQKQVEQPLTENNGFLAAVNRFKVYLRSLGIKSENPIDFDYYNQDHNNRYDLIVAIENYMTFKGEDYVMMLFYDPKLQKDFTINHFCARVLEEHMELFIKKVGKTFKNNTFGSETTFGQLMHELNNNVPANDWMSVLCGKNRQTALNEALLKFSNEYFYWQKTLAKINSAFQEYPDFPTKGINFKDWSNIFLDFKLVQELGQLIADSYRKECQDSSNLSIYDLKNSRIPSIIKKKKSMFFPIEYSGIDYIVGPESRGVWLAMCVQQALKCAMIPARKPGKLPGDIVSTSYTKEYGKDTLEMRNDLKAGKVLIVDDVLATGGSLKATIDLVEKAGHQVIGCVTVTDVPALRKQAQETLKGYWYTVLIRDD